MFLTHSLLPTYSVEILRGVKMLKISRIFKEDVSGAKILDGSTFPQVFKLFRTFGPQAIPVITVGNDVACMGKSEISETLAAIKSKL